MQKGSDPKANPDADVSDDLPKSAKEAVKEEGNSQGQETRSEPAKVDFMGQACPSGPRAEKSLEEEKEMARESLIYTLTIVFVCVIILLGLIYVPQYLKSSKLESDQYNHFSFVQDENGFWNTVVNKGDQPYTIPFYYHPRDLEDIILEENLRDKFFNIRDVGGSIFITLDPDADSNKIVIAGVEIAKITGERYGLLDVPTKSAFTKVPEGGSTNTATAVVTCDQADEDTMVIWLVVSGKNLVSSVGNCVVVEAKDYNETVRVADRLVYHLMGIMN